jgi:L-ascorbate metabolism protein UlaG (beta-lactamase superfamily)
MTVSYGDVQVDWLGYATIRLETPGTVAYIDPGRYGVLTGDWSADSKAAEHAHPPARRYRENDADIVFLTHIHHYDPDGIDRVADDGTTIVAFDGINERNSSRDLPRLVELPYETRRVGLESEGVVEDVPYWTVNAYNHPDGEHIDPDGTPHHPEGLGCGYLLSLDETRVFWPGDTDVLAGHAELDVDVLIPPIGGSFTMDRDGAAALADDLQPDLVVPIHYNTFQDLETDSQAFAADVASRGVPVALDEG